MYWQVQRTNNSNNWVEHTHEILQTLSIYSELITQMESGQRGFLISENDDFLDHYYKSERVLKDTYIKLTKLVSQNPEQLELVTKFGEKADAKLAQMRERIDQAKRGQLGEALAIVRRGDGKHLMDEFLFLRDVIAAREKSYLAKRSAEANTQEFYALLVALAGGVILIFVLLPTAVQASRRIGQPLAQLAEAIGEIEHGKAPSIVEISGDDEIAWLSRAFNKMTQHLAQTEEIRQKSEEEVIKANVDLQALANEMRARGIALDLLGRMAHRLQAAKDDAEFADIVSRFAPRILPGFGGALYLYNNSRNLITLAGSWQNRHELVHHFEPSQCWALRRGQEHRVEEIAHDVLCQHLRNHQKTPYVCRPLLAHGEIIGLLYLDGPVGADVDERVSILAENVSLAIVNQRLRDSLREQSIRDALTGLFNRRYLEESLQIELARAARDGTTVGVLMCDVDHFKKFNDSFGHDAGDAVLRVVAATLGHQVRSGDIVCRYGGEEMTVILPGASLEQVVDRAESIRAAVANLALDHHGQSLGQLTVSLGASIYPVHGQDGESLIARADSALYKAKQNGRNRVEVA